MGYFKFEDGARPGSTPTIGKREIVAFFLPFLFCILFSSCTPQLFRGMEGQGRRTIMKDELYTFAFEKGQTEVYNMELSFHNTSMNGLLAVEPEGDEQLRIVGTSLFGSTLIDAAITPKGMKIYACADQLKHKKLLRLLEKDFKTAFCRNFTADSYSAKCYQSLSPQTSGYVLTQPVGHKYFYKTDDANKRLTHIGTDGKLTSSTTSFTYQEGKPTPQTIFIEHPVLRLTIALSRTE